MSCLSDYVAKISFIEVNLVGDVHPTSPVMYCPGVLVPFKGAASECPTAMVNH